MQLSRQTIFLFTLNFFDAVLTIYWVRNGFASEGNQLMAGLLDIGDAAVSAVKIAVGAVTAMVLWRWRNLRLAKYGLAFALVDLYRFDGRSFRHRTFGFRLYFRRFYQRFRVLVAQYSCFFHNLAKNFSGRNSAVVYCSKQKPFFFVF